MLIDGTVKNYQLFIDSVNSSTFPIVYSKRSSKFELLSLLQHFSSIKRLAICFSSQLNKPVCFLDNKPLFLNNETYPYSENVQFMIDLINRFIVMNIDFLACNTLNYSNYVNYYQLLTKETNVVLGASNNKTGNLQVGGDWTMENTKEDIESIYFTKNIEYYTYLLDGGNTNASFVITKDNNIYGTGYNERGELGRGYYVNSILKLMINATGKTPKAISGDEFFTIILMTDGTVYGTGFNGYGQLGNGTTSTTSTLVAMTLPPGKTPSSISGGSFFTIVLMSDGTIYGTGNNGDGQLGDGTTTDTNTLVTMVLTMLPSGVKPIQVAAGDSFTIVLMSDGTVYGTGNNGDGQLGNGTTSSTSTLVAMTLPPGKTPSSISAGNYFTIVLMSDGSVYGTGSDTYGQLGDGTTTDTNTLVAMDLTMLPSGVKPIQIAGSNSFTIVLMSDGTVYGTGYNLVGQLGNGTNNDSNKLVPMITQSLTPITNVAAVMNVFVAAPTPTPTHTNINLLMCFMLLGNGSNRKRKRKSTM